MDRTITFYLKREKPLLYVGYVAKLQPGVDPTMPAVIPSDRQDGFYFTKDMQIRSYELAYHENPLITKDDWRKYFDERVAFTNNQSWNDKTGKVRADYVNDKNTNIEEPMLMKGIIISWNFYRGIPVGDKLRMTPGVHAIDGNKPMPDVATILKNNRYFEAVSNDPHHSPFPQGHGGKVLIPYILKWENDYPLDLFTEYSSDRLPQVSI